MKGAARRGRSAHAASALSATAAALSASGTLGQGVSFESADGAFLLKLSAVIQLRATDAEGNPIRYSSSLLPGGAVLDPNTGEEVAYFGVGDHPQRIRQGVVPETLVGSWA